MKTNYTSLNELNDTQTTIMTYISWWVNEKKTTVPLKEIIDNMIKEGIKKDTTVKALQVLLKKGYIRRAVVISNKSYFVKLRSI